MTTSTWATLFGSFLYATACGSSTPAPEHPLKCPPGQILVGQFCQFPNHGGPTPPRGTGTPSAGAGGASAEEHPNAAAGAGGTSPSLPPSANQLLTTGLTQLAKDFLVVGSQPEGETIFGNVAPGSPLERQLSLEPGRCYSIVGQAAPSVADLDIKLAPAVPQLGLPQVVVAEDKTDSPSAVLGSKPNCFRWAAPIAGQMQLTISAEQGSGPVAAQIFVK